MNKKSNNTITYLIIGVAVLSIGGYYFLTKEESGPTPGRRPGQLEAYKWTGADDEQKRKPAVDPNFQSVNAGDSIGARSGQRTGQAIPDKPTYEDLPLNFRRWTSLADEQMNLAYQYPSGQPERKTALKKAKVYLDSAEAAFNNPLLNISWGDYYMLTTQYDKAQQYYKDAIQTTAETADLIRNYVSASFNASLTAINSKDSIKAIQMLEQVLRYQPEDTDASRLIYPLYMGRSVSLLYESKHSAARKYLVRAHKIKPDDYFTNFNLGIANSRTGRPQEAIKNFEKCLSIKPGDQNATSYLFVLYQTVGDTAAANALVPENLR